MSWWSENVTDPWKSSIFYNAWDSIREEVFDEFLGLDSVVEFTLGGGFEEEIGRLGSWIDDEVIRPVYEFQKGFFQSLADDPLYAIAMAAAIILSPVFPPGPAIVAGIKTKSDGGTWGEAVIAGVATYVGAQVGAGIGDAAGQAASNVAGTTFSATTAASVGSVVGDVVGAGISAGTTEVIRGGSFQDAFENGALTAGLTMAVGYGLGKLEDASGIKLSKDVRSSELDDEAMGPPEPLPQRNVAGIPTNLKFVPRVVQDVIGATLAAELQNKKLDSEFFAGVITRSVITTEVIGNVVGKMRLDGTVEDSWFDSEQGARFMVAITPSIQNTIATIAVEGLNEESGRIAGENVYEALDAFGQAEIANQISGFMETTGKGLIDDALDIVGVGYGKLKDAITKQEALSDEVNVFINQRNEIMAPLEEQHRLLQEQQNLLGKSIGVNDLKLSQDDFNISIDNMGYIYSDNAEFLDGQRVDILGIKGDFPTDENRVGGAYYYLKDDDGDGESDNGGFDQYFLDFMEYQADPIGDISTYEFDYKNKIRQAVDNNFEGRESYDAIDSLGNPIKAYAIPVWQTSGTGGGSRGNEGLEQKFIHVSEDGQLLGGQQGYNTNGVTSTGDPLEGAVFRVTAQDTLDQLDNFNAAQDRFNLDWENIKDDISNLDVQIDAFSPDVLSGFDTIQTLVDEYTIANDSLGEVLKPFQDQTNSAFISALDPNFNSTQYKEINQLPSSLSDEEAREHFLSVGIKEDLNTNFESWQAEQAQAKTAYKDAVYSSLGIDPSTLSAEEAKAFNKVLNDKISSEFADVLGNVDASGIAATINTPEFGLNAPALFRDFRNELRPETPDLLDTLVAPAPTIEDVQGRPVWTPDNAFIAEGQPEPEVPFYLRPPNDDISWTDVVQGNAAVTYNEDTGRKEFVSAPKNDAGEYITRFDLLGDGATTVNSGQTLKDYQTTDPLGFFSIMQGAIAQEVHNATSDDVWVPDNFFIEGGTDWRPDNAFMDSEFTKTVDKEFGDGAFTFIDNTLQRLESSGMDQRSIDSITNTAANVLRAGGELLNSWNSATALIGIEPNSTAAAFFTQLEDVGTGYLTEDYAEGLVELSKIMDRDIDPNLSWYQQGIEKAKNIGEAALSNPGLFAAEFIGKEGIQELPSMLFGGLLGKAADVGIGFAQKTFGKEMLENTITEKILDAAGDAVTYAGSGFLDAMEAGGGAYDAAYEEAYAVEKARLNKLADQGLVLTNAQIEVQAEQVASAIAFENGWVSASMSTILSALGGNLSAERAIRQGGSKTAVEVLDRGKALLESGMSVAQVMLKEGLSEGFEEGAVQTHLESLLYSIDPTRPAAANVVGASLLGKIAGGPIAGGAQVITSTSSVGNNILGATKNAVSGAMNSTAQLLTTFNPTVKQAIDNAKVQGTEAIINLGQMFQRAGISDQAAADMLDLAAPELFISSSDVVDAFSMQGYVPTGAEIVNFTGMDRAAAGLDENFQPVNQQIVDYLFTLPDKGAGGGVGGTGLPINEDTGEPEYNLPTSNEEAGPAPVDADGNPILVDRNGNPLYDTNGNPILANEDNKPIFAPDGNEIQYDDNGNPISYDEFGNPVYVQNPWSDLDESSEPEPEPELEPVGLGPDDIDPVGEGDPIQDELFDMPVAEFPNQPWADPETEDPVLPETPREDVPIYDPATPIGSDDGDNPTDDDQQLPIQEQLPLDDPNADDFAPDIDPSVDLDTDTDEDGIPDYADETPYGEPEPEPEPEPEAEPEPEP